MHYNSCDYAIYQIFTKKRTHLTDDLDKIADGNLEWNKLLGLFYNDFEPKVQVAFKDMEKMEPPTLLLRM